MSLSSLIVQREVATMRQVEEALARQVIYGGDFVTNLLEVCRADEEAVVAILAESLGLPAAPHGELPIAQGSVRLLVPPEMAVERTMIPLVIEDGKVVVAVGERLPADVEEHLHFALGLAFDQRAALVVRIRQAISRVYGVPLERRMERLLARMSGVALHSDSMPPPLGAAPHVIEPPRPRSAPPPRATSRSFPGIREPSVAPQVASPMALAPPPATTAPPAPAVPTPVVRMADTDLDAADAMDRGRGGLLQREVSPGPRPARRRRGPLTIDAAKHEADEAADRDQLLDLFFDFSRQFFDYAALFLVHGDIAEGRDSFGAGASREKVLGIGVPLDLPGLVSNARDKRTAVVARAPADGLDAALLVDLLRSREAEMAIVPLVVRTRVVALLVADCGDAGIDRNSVQQVVGFAGVIGKGFERLIVRRKLDGFIAGSRATGAGRVDPAEVAAQLAPIGGALATPMVPAPPPAYVPSAPPGAVKLRPSYSAPPPASIPSAPPPPPANIATIRKISGPPIPREEPDAPSGGMASHAVWPSSDGRAEAAAPARSEPRLSPAPAAVRSREVTVPMLQHVAVAADAEALFDDPGIDDRETPVAGAPGVSAAIAVPLHAPPHRQLAREALPSVIVDIDQDVRSLMARVVAGQTDDAAEAELLRLGERAMRVIMESFPGPVTFERARLASVTFPPRASECGPVLHLVARQRKVALPFVLAKVDGDDAEVRGWATHLLAELPYLEAMPRLLLRLRDGDAATRKSAALSIAAVARAFPEEVHATINELAHASDALDRVAAMNAMAELREPTQVPEMIRALGDGNEAVVDAAEVALGTVTRQDLGTDARRWIKWWDHNGSRPRIEWLIDALMHEVLEMRRAAGDELKALTKEYFGYSAELPSRDRERAQQRYRDWWLTEGKARFSRRP